MNVELKIPQAGESINEVEVGDWLKKEGERVERDEPVVEIQTDKASMELPSPVSGVIAKILHKPGDIVKVGQVIAHISENGAAASVKPSASATPAGVGASAPVGTAAASRGVGPAARQALREHGLSANDVRGTGPGGRVLPADVAQAARHEVKPEMPAARPAAPAISGERQVEVVPMTSIRRRIAERLVEAQHSAALLTTFNEIDMSAVMELRKRDQEAFQEKYGVKLGFMSFFVKATIEALKFIPQLNAEIQGTNIVYHNYYDIGIAVGTGKGLVVPILRSAERMSFADIEKAIIDFGKRAQDNKLSVDELKGGTFTISNGGVFGSLLSTPIVNPPQSGILGLHAIQERPVVRDGQIVIRSMMYAALTYDHRLVDGREAVTFLKRIKENVENPARMLLEV